MKNCDHEGRLRSFPLCFPNSQRNCKVTSSINKREQTKYAIYTHTEMYEFVQVTFKKKKPESPFKSSPTSFHVFRWPLTLRNSERSKFPKASVAACPALSTLQAERFLWILPTFRRRKRPSSVGPTTSLSPSLHIPLKHRPSHKHKLFLV